MLETDFTFEMTPETQRRLSIIFNTRRKEYSDFTEFFKSNDVQTTIADWFENMFDSSGNGTWSISGRHASWKASKGYSTKPNIMTGRMKAATTRRMGKSTDGFSTNIALREYKPLQMTWGINVNDPSFQTKKSPYPEYALALNGLIEFNDKFMSDIAKFFGEYMLNIFENTNPGGLGL